MFIRLFCFMDIKKIFNGLFKQKSAYLGRSDLGLVQRLFGESWGERTFLEQYGKSLYVYACVSKIAEKYASIDFRLKRIINGKGDVKEVKNHEILDIIYKPNQFFTKEEFFEADVINRKLSGDSYIVKIRNNYGQVVELWPYRPDLVEIVTDPDKYISHYNITKDDGSKKKIEPSDMIHIKYPSPLNQFLGLSPLSAAKSRINTENYATAYQENFFINNARPDAMLETDQNLSPTQRKELKESWEKNHKGKGKNSKVGFLWGGLKYHQISLNQQEMDYIESMKFTREDIMLAFKTPKPILGITEDVNRANAEASMQIFLSETIIPETRRLINKLNEELIIPDFGDEYFLEFVDPVPVDRVQRLAELTAGVDRWITRNEARSETGFDPVDGGDVLYGSLTQIPLGEPRSNYQEDPDNSKNLHGRRLLRMKMQLREEFREEIKNITKGVKENLKKQAEKTDGKKSKEIKDNSLFKDETKRKQYWDYRMKDIDRKSTKIKTLVVGLSNKQAEEFTAEFEKENPKTKKDIKAIFNIKEQIKTFKKKIMPLMVSIFEEAGSDAVDLIGEKSFEIYQEKELLPEILDLLDKRAAFFAKSVNNTTLESLADTLNEGINEGEGIPELKKRIKAIYDEFENYRAEMIARTETNAVVNEAHLEAYAQSQLIEGKEWIATLDDRVRDSHLMLDGEQVEAEGKFSNGLRYPGEASGDGGETINCRCTIAPVTKLK